MNKNNVTKQHNKNQQLCVSTEIVTSKEQHAVSHILSLSTTTIKARIHSTYFSSSKATTPK